MAIMDADARVLHANRALCEMLGRSEAQLQLRSLVDFVHPDDVADQEVQCGRLMSGEAESYAAEWRYVHSNGHIVSGQVACCVVRDASGAPERFILQLQDITERILTERMLREGEERFRSLTMLSSDWYWEQDEQFRFVSSASGSQGAWLPDFYRGGPSQVGKFIGKRRWEQPDVYPVSSSWAEHRAVVEAHQPFRDFEYMRTVAGQPPRYISSNGEPLFDAAGVFKGYRGTARDITPRKLAEQKLVEAQSLLNMAAQIGRLGGWSYEVADDLVTWSEEVCAIHEVPRGFTMKSEKTLDFYASGHRGRMYRLLKACLDNGTPFDVETQVRTAKGHILWVRVIAEAQWDEQGKVKRVLGALQDISDARSAADDAFAMAQQLTTTLESLTDAFFTVDREWRFTYLNTEAEKLLRRPRRELLGKKMYHEFAELKASQFPHHYQRAMHDNVAVQFEAFYPPFEIWVHVKIYPSKQGLAVYCRDVTERIRAQKEVLRLNAELEERVRQRTSELEQANKDLESFSYSIAHDLRAPLSSIDGFSRALEELAGPALGDPAQHYLRRVRAGVRQMAELTDDLLTLSSLSKGAVQRQPMDLAALARTQAATFREQSPARNVKIDIEPALNVDGDGRLVPQLVANLLGNSWKFTRGRADAHIEIGRCKPQENGTPVFYVRDNGAGFDMAYAARLFQPFHRLHTPAEFEGNGVGLAIAGKIVARHGGRIWAESKPGEGATFWFTLAP
ncbi:MAG TPA: PAS domain S-box protein, partial [Ramlibacter sp.]|nr:PAS domain S-box protein [Ramlibacter sp.]